VLTQRLRTKEIKVQEAKWCSYVQNCQKDAGTMLKASEICGGENSSSKISTPFYIRRKLTQCYAKRRSTRCTVHTIYVKEQDTVVGLATRHYGLVGLGIEFRWQRDLFAPAQAGPGVQPTFLYNGYRVSFPGVKRLERGVDHPPPSIRRGLLPF